MSHEHVSDHLCDDCKAELDSDIRLMLQIVNCPVSDEVAELSNNLLYSFLVERYAVCDCEEDDDGFMSNIPSGYTVNTTNGSGTITTSTATGTIDVINMSDVFRHITGK